MKEHTTVICWTNICCCFYLDVWKLRFVLEKLWGVAHLQLCGSRGYLYIIASPGSQYTIGNSNVDEFVSYLWKIFERSEVLRRFRHYMQAQSQGHHTVDHLVTSTPKATPMLMNLFLIFGRSLNSLKCWGALDSICGHKAKDITPLITS